MRVSDFTKRLYAIPTLVGLPVAAAILIFSFCSLASQNLTCLAQETEGPYAVDDTQVRKEGVPQGKIIKAKFANSKIFPGTERSYAIYVPDQYDASKPACLMVFQDGMGFANEKRASKVPIVFDNMIHSKMMPVTIGVFIDPGVVPAQSQNAQPRFNRSLEYDAIDDRYVNFLLNELLPEVEQDYSISKLARDRGICGSSSGGIAAFNVAWQRPDKFSRVYTMVGTYIGLRGANEMSVLVRKTEPKPIRVYLQDGSKDLNIYCGDWWVANQGMLSALTFSGYEVDHVWGEGGHNKNHGGAVFPDAMRYIWKDWPEPVSTHFDKSKSRAPEMLVDGEEWELVSKGHKFITSIDADEKGIVYFAAQKQGTVFCVDENGETSKFWDRQTWGSDLEFIDDKKSPSVSAVAVGPDGSVYGSLPFIKAIVKFKGDESHQFEEVISGVKARDFVIANNGTIYFTDDESKSVWIQKQGGEKKLAVDGLSGAHGIALSPDQTLVYVSDYNGRYVWSCVRAADGSLAHAQPYFHIHSPPASVDIRTRSHGMCVDQDGWLLVATKMGIQVCDQPGRVNFIMTFPAGVRHPHDVAFGGQDSQTIFAACGGRVFKRKTKLSGAMPWAKPVKPPKPGL